MNLNNTYCNPIVLPDYPIGKFCHDYDIPSFRETADPSVIFYDGKWYLYPSCGMAYVSENFVNWEHKRIEPYEMGYAPTVVQHKGKFYMTACSAELKVSDNPLGPFESLGDFKTLSGDPHQVADPMLFSDDDERLYLYWGLCNPGIFGVELDANNPTQFISEPKLLFKYNPDHIWERIGEWNEDASNSYVEGSWMVKVSGTYYLTYCAPGTEWRTYAMGAYICSSPLGEFTYQDINPITSKRDGIVRGPGHGCIVKGPNDTLWAFYTCTLCYAHMFERRIGVDSVKIDENGNLCVPNITEIPQWAPGLYAHPEDGNNVGIIPVTFRRYSWATSCSEGRDALYAFDDSMLSWWQPSASDARPELYVNLCNVFKISAMRIIWRDVGLDVRHAIYPVPFQYKLEAKLGKGEWVTVVDASDNSIDLSIDYRTFDEIEATDVRLVITNRPEKITPAVISLTVFGKSSRWYNSEIE